MNRGDLDVGCSGTYRRRRGCDRNRGDLDVGCSGKCRRRRGCGVNRGDRDSGGLCRGIGRAS